MKIITNIVNTIEHGPYAISKQEFLNIKMKFRVRCPKPTFELAKEFLVQNTTLKEEAIDVLALFFLRNDFRIEE